MDEKKEICFGIGKYQKAILDVVKGEDGSRPHLGGIKITKDGYAVATDTKTLVKIPLNDVKKDELPVDGEKGGINALTGDIWVSAKGLNKALKHLPGNKALPILNNIYIREDKDKISLVANDLENQVEVKENKKICQENAEKYPKVKEMLGLPDNMKYQITMGIPALKKLVDILGKMINERGRGITLFFGERENPVHFMFSVGEDNRRTAIGAIMPMRDGNTEAQNIEEYQSVNGTKKEAAVK